MKPSCVHTPEYTQCTAGDCLYDPSRGEQQWPGILCGLGRLQDSLPNTDHMGSKSTVTLGPPLSPHPMLIFNISYLSGKLSEFQGFYGTNEQRAGGAGTPGTSYPASAPDPGHPRERKAASPAYLP